MPEFGSPAFFAALLDPVNGGRFAITPSKKYESSQKYVISTNVVHTHFHTPSGEARLVDAFIAISETEKVLALFPDHEILRVLEGVSGTVNLKIELSPRPFYGKYAAELKDRKRMGIHISRKILRPHFSVNACVNTCTGRPTGRGTIIASPRWLENAITNLKAMEGMRTLPLKILIIEDDPEILNTLNVYLGTMGFDVDVMSNGTEILKNQFVPPDLFLVDQRLPDVDGLEICRNLRSKPNYRDIPIIIMSANANIRKQALEAGAFDFIAKPFALTELIRTVTRSLEVNGAVH